VNYKNNLKVGIKMQKLFISLALIICCAGVNIAQIEPYVREKEKPSEKPKEAEEKKEKTTPKKEHKSSESSLRDRLFFGGNLGFSSGTNSGISSTIVDISPMVGYKITDKLQAGGGAIYQYYQTNYYGANASYNNWGGRAFTRYMLYESFFPHLEFEYISLDRRRIVNGVQEKYRQGITSLYVGAGYSVPLGDRSSLSLTILYNVLWSEANKYTYSPFSTRIWFQF
jgi:hypothetical protein